jgi:serine/threonine protein kinase
MSPSSTQQTGNTQAGQGQGGPAMALSDSHFQVLVQMEGYTLLPEDDGRRSMTVAKAVSGGQVVALKLIRPDNMNELTILEHLQTFQSLRNHTIKLLRVIHSDCVADIIVMPWQSPLNIFLRRHASLDMVVLLRFQIMEGVWFLHEHLIAHLDLKPENIFVGHTDSLSPLARLSIGDYGISVRVEDEESTVEGYRGTPFWSAPEVGTEDGPKLKYSAIRADRWSCGRVVHYLAQFHPLNDGLAFGSTYEQLLNPDPRRRPSLDEAIHTLQPVSVIKRGSSTDFASASQKRTRLG